MFYENWMLKNKGLGFRVVFQTFLLLSLLRNRGRLVCFDDTKVERGEGGDSQPWRGFAHCKPLAISHCKLQNMNKVCENCFLFPFACEQGRGSLLAISVIFNFQNFWVLLSYSMGGMMLQLLKLKCDGLVGNGFKVYIWASNVEVVIVWC